MAGNSTSAGLTVGVIAVVGGILIGIIYVMIFIIGWIFNNNNFLNLDSQTYQLIIMLKDLFAYFIAVAIAVLVGYLAVRVNRRSITSLGNVVRLSLLGGLIVGIISFLVCLVYDFFLYPATNNYYSYYGYSIWNDQSYLAYHFLNDASLVVVFILLAIAGGAICAWMSRDLVFSRSV